MFDGGQEWNMIKCKGFVTQKEKIVGDDLLLDDSSVLELIKKDENYLMSVHQKNKCDINCLVQKLLLSVQRRSDGPHDLSGTRSWQATYLLTAVSYISSGDVSSGSNS